jgi:peptidoglycan/xylan/chitin deacetylase (PgdA/CDA1 family)
MKIKSLKYGAVTHIFTGIPFAISQKLTQINLIVPLYHMISNEEVLHFKHLNEYKNVKQFVDDLNYLLKRYVPVSLFDIADFLKNGHSLPDRAFLLTFDDGFREMHDVVAPILLKKGVPATFFLTTDFIDNRRMCYLHKASILAEHFQKTRNSRLSEKIKELVLRNNIQTEDAKPGILSINYQQRGVIDEIAQLMNIDFDNYLSINKPYLTSAQIEKLIGDGFAIGAHSIDHPLFSSLDLKEQLYQAVESVKCIRERFGLNYGAFAFPHDDIDVSIRFFNELYNSGLVDVSFGTGGMIEDVVPNNIQRINFEKPLMPAETILALAFTRRLLNMMKGKRKMTRKV